MLISRKRLTSVSRDSGAVSRDLRAGLVLDPVREVAFSLGPVARMFAGVLPRIERSERLVMSDFRHVPPTGSATRYTKYRRVFLVVSQDVLLHFRRD